VAQSRDRLSVEPCAVVSVRRLPDRFGLGWVRVDDTSEGAQTDPRDHRQGYLVIIPPA
jgi:hypothetical protein